MDAMDGEQIAAVFESAAVLAVRHLNFGQSLTSAWVLAQLDDVGRHESRSWQRQAASASQR
jgi:hypothetical protein